MIEKPGDYVLWARVRAAGPQRARSDSFFVQMNDRPDIAWHMPATDTWTWARVTSGTEQSSVTFSLTAGQHTLQFKTRESGAQVDCLVLSPNTGGGPVATTVPSGVGFESESGQVTAPMRIVNWHLNNHSRLRLHLRAGAPVQIETDAYEDHPRLKAMTRATEPRFLAVLLPLPPSMPEPDVMTSREGGCWRVQIRWKSRYDSIHVPLRSDQQPQVQQERNPKPE